jgi:hypothetical protein
MKERNILTKKLLNCCGYIAQYNCKTKENYEQLIRVSLRLEEDKDNTSQGVTSSFDWVY